MGTTGEGGLENNPMKDCIENKSLVELFKHFVFIITIFLFISDFSCNSDFGFDQF